MIERLKKLLAECINAPEKTCPMPEETTCDGCKYDMVHGGCDMIGRYADHLLTNGVLVPPVKMKQTVYSIERGISQVMAGEVYEICIRREGVVFRATRKGYFSLAFTADNIGKTVFFTKEEAEKALAAGKEQT